jgi:hypothetical protein
VHNFRDINIAWETTRENIKIPALKSLDYYEFQKHKPRFDNRCSELLNQRKQAKLQWLQDKQNKWGYVNTRREEKGGGGIS